MASFKKTILPHKKFYIAAFSKNPKASYLVFIHGGPGLNCGAIEYFIEHEDLFQLLNYNIILYDQRACGRSAILVQDSEKITHTDNINDVDEIYKYLELNNIKVEGFIGHSYGAKLLFDFLKIKDLGIPAIFVSTSDSILVPRLNNLTLDLNYLKKTHPSQYEKIIDKIDFFDLKKLWEITEELAPLFQKNKERQYFYWSNLTAFKKYLKIQSLINLPSNTQVFMSVRKSLYKDKINFNINIEELCVPYIWINGIHDYIMNGASSLMCHSSKIIPFYKSSHYPHIEESHRFCQLVNKFLE